MPAHRNGPVSSNVRPFNPMRTPISVRIKAFFAMDNYADWWNHFTDEEARLRRMDAWQLAKVIHEANVHQNNPEKRIVAEHMLNVRLAKIQSRPAWFAIAAGILGIAGGAILNSLLQQPNIAVNCVYEHKETGAALNKQKEQSNVLPKNPATGNIADVPVNINKKH